MRKTKVGRPKEDRDVAIYARIKSVNAAWLKKRSKKDKISYSRGLDALLAMARQNDVSFRGITG